MKQRILAILVFGSFLVAVVKVATAETVELVKYLVVQAHDLWVFLLTVWK